MARSNSTNREVVVATWGLIDRLEAKSRYLYARRDCSPAGDLTLEVLAMLLGGRIVEEDLGPHIQEVGIPGYCCPPTIVINSQLSSRVARLAKRHGLAHLAAGELEVGAGAEVRFMSNILDFMTFEERRADLFALADLIPDDELEGLITQGKGSTELLGYIDTRTRLFAPPWSTRRLRDRVRLRYELFADRRE